MFYRWTRADEREQRLVDLALDAGRAPAAPDAPVEPVYDLPWWEKDQSSFDPARAARYRADARRRARGSPDP
jgi:hypothetical protein